MCVFYFLFDMTISINKYSIYKKNPSSNSLTDFHAERQALEPVLSQNITQSQMPINNQLITIIIKSKYY